jgi:hypothetical protein
MQIMFIFLYIHKQSTIIKLSYEKQRNEKQKEELLLRKNMLIQQLQGLQNRTIVKEYATKKLGMKKIQLPQIMVLPDE